MLEFERFISERFSIYSKIQIISLKYGIDSAAPFRDTVIEEAFEAISNAYSTLFPFVIAAKK